MSKRLTALLLSSLTLGACSSILPAAEPERTLAMSLPDRYDHANEMEQTRELYPVWWAGFDDDVLSGLMARGLKANLSLENGLANLRASRAAVDVSRASLLPSASAGVSASTDTNSGLDDISATGRLSASYELDLFKRNQLGVETSELSYQAALYDQKALELSVQADIAINYFNLLSARNQLDVARRNLEISERIYKIVEARYNAGDVSGYDLASQRSSLASARARIPQIEAQIESYEAALAILLGVPPQGFSVGEGDLLDIDIPALTIGLPSELLTRRPDLMSAETALREADINVEIARKAFLPSVDLSAGLSSLLTDTFDPVGSLSASLSLPLFTGGQLEGQLEAARARADAALINYRQTVLSALQDVDVSLSGLKADQAVAGDLLDAETAAARALEIAEIRYKVGADNLTSLLNAQQTYDSASQSVVENKRDQLVSLINLYVAIGGGWTAGN